MRYSVEQSNLSAALSIAQGEIQNAATDSTNPHYKSEYTSLAGALDVVRPVFAKNGLSVVQMPTVLGEQMYLTTRLLHKSGEYLEGDYPILPVKTDPQGYGAAVTYARRYSLMAVAGIAPEDDDGNEASGKTDSNEPKAEHRPRFTAPSANQQPKPATNSKVVEFVPAAKLHDLIKLAKTLEPSADQERAKQIVIEAAERHGIKKITAITQAQFVKIEDELKQTKIS